ncbi:MAG: DUF2490 domain-containing protein [Sandaracinaceae bacterium]
MRAILVVVAVLHVASTGMAQAEPDEPARQRATFWLGYMSSVVVRPDIAIWFDTHYNHEAFFVLRGGLTVGAIGRGATATAGYAYLLLSDGTGALRRMEHRPWAQVVIPARDGDWGFSQRIRYDARFREDLPAPGVVGLGYIFTNRLRWQSVVTRWLPPSSFGRFLLQLADEVLVSFGPVAGPNFLDQNRLSALVGLRVRAITWRVGYMYRFLPGSTGVRPRHEHAVLLWVTHTIDLPSVPAPGVGDDEEHPPSVPEAGSP